jgi:hypothetical protein
MYFYDIMTGLINSCMSLDRSTSGPYFRPQVREITHTYVQENEVIDYKDKGFEEALKYSNTQLKECAKIAYFNSPDEILIHFSKDLMILRKIPRDETDEQKITEIGNAVDTIIGKINEMDPVKQKKYNSCIRGFYHAITICIMELSYEKTVSKCKFSRFCKTHSAICRPGKEI